MAAVYGGVGYGPQRKMLAQGPSVVVACPGRLEDLVSTGDVVLDRAEVVVLDEADRMADMGSLPAVRRLLDLTPSRRQTMLFSATLDGDVASWSATTRRTPPTTPPRTSARPTPRRSSTTPAVPRPKRVPLVADIVARTGSTSPHPHPPRCRQGGPPARPGRRQGRADPRPPDPGPARPGPRQSSTGRAPVLVATDVAARGIHVDGVTCIVHFDLPDDAKDYVHRSGRTGRAGATGLVVALVPDDEHKAARARCGPSAARSRSRSRTSAASSEPELAPCLFPPAPAPAAARPGPGPRPRCPDGDVWEGEGLAGEDGEVLRRRPRLRVHHPPGGNDVFVHVSALGDRARDLRPGQRVRFELARSKRGQQAKNVQPAG